MVTETENETTVELSSEHQFKYCVAELIKAKEKMTQDAVTSGEAKRIKSALILLLEGNKTLITALDSAYKKLHEARLNIKSVHDQLP